MPIVVGEDNVVTMYSLDGSPKEERFVYLTFTHEEHSVSTISIHHSDLPDDVAVGSILKLVKQ